MTGVLEHCHEGETNSRFSIFWVFPSDRIPKVMKDVSVHLFIDSFTFRDEFIIIITNSCKLYQWIPGTFWSYCILAKHVDYTCHVFSLKM